jgi:hypothetical protein
MNNQLTFEGRPIEELSKEELINALYVLYRMYQQEVKSSASECKVWQSFAEAR